MISDHGERTRPEEPGRIVDVIGGDDRLARVLHAARRRDEFERHAARMKPVRRPKPAHVSVDGLEQQVDETAAALAETRGERKTTQRFAGRPGCQLIAGDADRLQLEMTAADRAADVRRSHDHLRAGPTRYGALRRHDGDDDGGGVPLPQSDQIVEPASHSTTASVAIAVARVFSRRTAISSSERSTDSGVAGASRRGDNL